MQSRIELLESIDSLERQNSLYEEQIADLKANFDYVLEGKDLEIKELGERCKQLELIILGNQEEIAGLEQQIEKMKTDLNNAIESASKWYVQDPVCSMLVDIYNDNFEDKWEIKEND